MRRRTEEVRKKLAFLVAVAMMLAMMLAMSATAWAAAANVPPKFTCTPTDPKEFIAFDLNPGQALSGLKSGQYSECFLQQDKPDF